jgi:SH3-like domain-containing protein
MPRRKAGRAARAGALLALIGLIAFTAQVAAAERALPRFVSLRADKVNVRAGPGVQYPVVWVFVRRGLPVEIVAEFDLWRKIRDREGVEGWVHRSLLAGTRAVIVTGDTHVLFRDPDARSAPVAQVEAGVVARLLACTVGWCRVKAASHRGWIERAHLWGVYPNEQKFD